MDISWFTNKTMLKSMSIALYYVGPCLFWLSSSHWKIIDTKVVKMSLEQIVTCYHIMRNTWSIYASYLPVVLCLKETEFFFNTINWLANCQFKRRWLWCLKWQIRIVFISYRHSKTNVVGLNQFGIRLKILPDVLPQPLPRLLQDSFLRCQSVCQKIESGDDWYLILICGIIYQLIS